MSALACPPRLLSFDLIANRALIDIVRASGGLGGFSYTAGPEVQAAQFNEFATALNDVWFTILGLPLYTLPAVAAGQPIKAAPLNALRQILR